MVDSTGDNCVSKDYLVLPGLLFPKGMFTRQILMRVLMQIKICCKIRLKWEIRNVVHTVFEICDAQKKRSYISLLSWNEIRFHIGQPRLQLAPLK